MSFQEKFSPLDEWAHKYASSSRYASIAALAAKPKYRMSDAEEELVDALRVMIDGFADAMSEVLVLRHRSGYRDRANLDIIEDRCDKYRAVTGDNWVQKARENGL